MCAPDYYACKYVINPWMVGNNEAGRVSVEIATHQWRALFNAVSNHSNVLVAQQLESAPDMVFTANAGLVIGNKAVVATFKYPERQVETPAFDKVFRYLGFDTIVPPDGLVFEGAGDCLYDSARGIYWIGSGFRSDREAAMWLHGQFPDEIFIQLRLNQDGHFYHLDTCFAPLPNGEILWYPDAFDASTQAVIKASLSPAESIPITASEAKAFACNCVAVGNTVIFNECPTSSQNVPPDESPVHVDDLSVDRIKAILTERGYDVITLDLSEFIKTGGSAKCLTLTVR